MPKPTVSTAKGISSPKGIKITTPELQNAKFAHHNQGQKREKESRTDPIPNSDTSPLVMAEHQSSYLA